MKNSDQQPINVRPIGMLFLSFLFLLGVACEKTDGDLVSDTHDLSLKKNMSAGPIPFQGAVFDISATPDGSVMVAVNGASTSIQLIKNGKVTEMVEVEVSTAIQGLQSIGAGNAFFTTAGSDLAKDGELYRLSNGNYRMVADLGQFEEANDPDAFEGIKWKNQACEDYGDFSAGPQNNPFKVAALNGGTALVADAAGNTILSANTNGEIDWKAILTPPVNENGEYMVLFERDGIDCYVQPVPTSIAIADDYVYVGELTGEIPNFQPPIGLSRVWKIPVDANNVVCSAKDPSEDCTLFLSGLTSIIDLEIGPDGLLYVVEYDENSWFASIGFATPIGGTISAYNEEGNLVKSVTGLEFPSAITFDKKGNLWLLEKNIMGPTVRALDDSVFNYE